MNLSKNHKCAQGDRNNSKCLSILFDTSLLFKFFLESLILDDNSPFAGFFDRGNQATKQAYYRICQNLSEHESIKHAKFCQNFF